MSDYGDDHSRADLALCCILARAFHNDIFKIDEQFFRNPGCTAKSGNAPTTAHSRF